MSGRAIVTGGTGYVGRFIVERLLADGWQVTVLGRTPPGDGFFSRSVSFRSFDLDQATPAFFGGGEVLVHCAFDHVPGRYRGGEGDDPDAFRRRNVAGSIALFDAARQAGVGRALFLSSRAVYGTQAPGAVLSEDMECRPDTLYGEAKLAVERALSAMASPAFRTATLRVTGVYGPAGAGAAHKWQGLIDDVRAGRPVATRAGTEVHGEDVARAVVVAIRALADETAALTLNVSDIVVDNADLVAILNARVGMSGALPPRADEAGLNVMATDRLRALGWTPGGTALLERTVRALAHEAGGDAQSI